MDEYIAAIDAGTGGVRCVVYDASGNVLCQDYRELLTAYSPDGRAEQDPVQLVRSACDAVRGALIRGGIDASSIAGISVTGTQTTFVPLDGDGNYLCNMILWQDARGLEMMPHIRARLARAGLSEDELYRRTLRPLDALLEGAKLLWLREHRPKLYGRIRALANPQAVLLRALGAEEIRVDPTDTGWWLAHDAVSMAVDRRLVEAFDLDPGIFPVVRACGEMAGRVSPRAAEHTGLAAGVPLFQGAVDQCCAALGAGNFGTTKIATLCMGTAGVLMTYGEDPVPDPLGRAYVIHYPTGGYASEYAVPVAASAFRWVRDVLCPAGAFDGPDVYARMDEAAARSPIGAGGVAFLPHLAGSIYPQADARVRGGWVGASLSTGRSELIRAALEGICFEMREVMEAGGRPFETLRLLGGASRSEIWNQMQADVYGCPVETIAAQEASALGAAMIAAAGAGLYPDIAEAVRSMCALKRRYEPDPQASERYEAAYRAWRACLEGLRPAAFPALAALRAGEGR